MEEVGDLLHLGLLHATTGKRVGADANSTRDGSALIALNGVLVEGDVREVADLLNLGAGEAEGTEIPEDEVVVRARGLELVVVREEGLGDRLRVEGVSGGGSEDVRRRTYAGVGDDLGGVVLEGLGVDLLEGNSDTGDGL